MSLLLIWKTMSILRCTCVQLISTIGRIAKCQGETDYLKIMIYLWLWHDQGVFTMKQNDFDRKMLKLLSIKWVGWLIIITLR